MIMQVMTEMKSIGTIGCTGSLIVVVKRQKTKMQNSWLKL
ncbi:Uncharacterised protein [Mycobacteroides abscessus subsp. abscessus]|nr:Uncharacterised protein [Mycobacteroides abscessus subsp. abscessus]